MQVPRRKAGKYSGGPADDHLTHAAIADLKEELERIQTHVRPRAVEELRRTREMGDLSENFAYSVAKGKVLGLDARIQEIQERLKRAVPIRHGPGQGGTIRLGATVTLSVNGKERVYDIVGAQEANPTAGAISYHSPLGAALIGRKAGETVTIDANDRKIDYRIMEVR